MTTVRVFNTTDFVSLRDTDTIAKAARTLCDLQHRVSALPVTDADGKLIGIFTVDRLLKLLLPAAATVNSGLLDLSFVSDTLEHVREKMRSIAEHPVSRHLEQPPRAVHPDTPLMEVMLLLYRGENDLPVTDERSGKLLGIVSAIDILRAVQGAENK